MRTRILTFAVLSLLLALPLLAADPDPNLWLEEIDSPAALEWVEATCSKDVAELEAVPEFASIHASLLEIFNSADRIPYAGLRGEWLYNFWQDAEHVRGIWRRTSLDQYVTDEPAWETVLDLDALAAAEGENWVWKGSTSLPPEHRLVLISLSRGGGDAVVVREFDTVAKEFVADGFVLPEAKSDLGWRDQNTVWVGTDFGEGTLTDSGYPRLVKSWTRGTPLSEAAPVFEGLAGDVSVGAYSLHTPEGRYDFVYQIPEFFRGTYFLIRDGELVKLDFPEDAEPRGVFKEQLLVSLRSDWTAGGAVYPQDALLAIGLDRFLAGERDFEVLFTPEERVSLGGVDHTADHLLLTTLDNVRGRLYRLTFADGSWTRQEVTLPGLGTVAITTTSDRDDTYFFSYTDFLTPASLFLALPGQEPKQIKTAPDFFDAAGMSVDQYEAVSADGTRIPYFIVTPPGFTADGTAPTLLYGYGGFEVSMRPRYSGATGAAWVARGGVYVLANIRGGGEFGPRWHQAALQENRQRCFDDFIAVAEDLIARKVTSPAHLGIAGGSNGGLLVGAVFTQRPELFNAVVCQVPLLDMKRYHQLLAGASWMAEYGDPDSDDWEFMKKWSPYQNLDAAKTYPQVFFTTSTRDDRVHPGHARKMVKRMTDMGKPVYYYENTEGGHGGAANMNQRAYMWGLTYAYLWKMLR